MCLSQINWLRGVTRVYILVVVAWFSYWILWLPLHSVHEWQYLAIHTQDTTERDKLWEQATLIAQWRELGRDLARTPVESALLLLLPPLLGYVVLRVIVAVIAWVIRGFRNEEASP